MWIAVAILGVIAIATGISVLPGGQPNAKPDQIAPAAPAAPATPVTPAAPATPGETPGK